MDKIIDKIKNIISVVVNFATGLGFYGLGLLAAGIGVWLFFGWDHIASGLVGAFVFKNFKAIVDWIKETFNIS